VTTDGIEDGVELQTLSQTDSEIEINKEKNFSEIVKMPIFWAVTCPYSVFNMFWGGFNYHSADIMKHYAKFEP
jgi:hypothetical protein